MSGDGMQSGMRPVDVLVVDDEGIVREAVRRVLIAEGLNVAVAADAAEALAHPALARCRLVVCDLMLPDLPGTELVRRIVARHPKLPVIVITGYATATTQADALEAGARDVLPKPFDHDELLSVVQRALAPESRERAVARTAAWRSSSGDGS